MPTLGPELAAARKARNMSRENLALMSGVSFDKVKRMEDGHQPNPRVDDLLRICGVLGCPIGSVIAHPERGATPWLRS